MTLAAITGGVARRDFWDLHALLLLLNYDLEPALALNVQKYPVEDVGHVLKSLVYFADAEQEPLLSKLSAWMSDGLLAPQLRRISPPALGPVTPRVSRKRIET